MHDCRSSLRGASGNPVARHSRQCRRLPSMLAMRSTIRNQPKHIPRKQRPFMGTPTLPDMSDCLCRRKSPWDDFTVPHLNHLKLALPNEFRDHLSGDHLKSSVVRCAGQAFANEDSDIECTQFSVCTPGQQFASEVTPRNVAHSYFGTNFNLSTGSNPGTL